MEVDDFTKSWRKLQDQKEIQVQKALDQGRETVATRNDIQVAAFWADTLVEIDKNPMLEKDLALARTPLESLLLLETTNAQVERDAATKRILKDVMHNAGTADTTDARI